MVLLRGKEKQEATLMGEILFVRRGERAINVHTISFAILNKSSNRKSRKREEVNKTKRVRSCGRTS